MAISFKTLTQTDKTTSRTLLHESIPITGTLVSGTYNVDSSGREVNIKTFSHGMFQSVYDYPYTSSSANHIFDVTTGFSTASGTPTGNSSVSSSAVAHAAASQLSKKVNIYTQMAQVLAGFNTSSIVRRFDQDGDLSTASSIKHDNAIFLNFSRLLVKDEIKKGSFSLELGHGSWELPFVGGNAPFVITDAAATTSYKINSPAGEYGILKSTATAASVTVSFSNAPTATRAITILALKADGTTQSATFTAQASANTGLNFSRAGATADVAANLFSAITRNADIKDLVSVSRTGTTLTITQVNAGAAGNTTVTSNLDNVSVGGASAGANGVFTGGVTTGDVGLVYYQAGVAILSSSVFPSSVVMSPLHGNVEDVLTGSTIDVMADSVRKRIKNVQFSNTTELNSTIYFCRANNTEFNYSSNPTYLSGSKIRVKTNPGTNEHFNLPRSYVTTVGLYSHDNELLAVAKLSEPLRKDPTNELTLRVRLDY